LCPKGAMDMELGLKRLAVTAAKVAAAAITGYVLAASALCELAGWLDEWDDNLNVWGDDD
jgi:hypothetical protein